MKNLIETLEKIQDKEVTTEVVEFVNFLRELRELTNKNARTEARLKIANYFSAFLTRYYDNNLKLK